MAVPLCGFVVSLAFPVYLNTFKARELDGFRETKIGYHDERRGTVIGDINDQLEIAAMEKRAMSRAQEA
jgi:hypothetical protein